MTASFYTGAQLPNHKTNKGSKDHFCIYRRNIHSATNCNVITDHSKRLEYIKKEGLCFNCLEKHRVAQCISRNRCKWCTHKHHTSVCEAYANSRSPMNNQPSSQPNQHGQSDVGEAEQSTTTTPVHKTPASNPSTSVTTTLTSTPQSSVLFNPSDSVCLLKTAVTEIKSDKTSVIANILFDEGASTLFYFTIAC